MFSTKELQDYLVDLKYLLSIETPTNSKFGIYRATKFLVKKSKQFKLPVKYYFHKYNKKAGRTLLISNVENPLENEFDVLLMAHLDTVYKKGTFKKTGFVLEGDTLKSPGCIDDKGPALMGLYALKHIDLSKLKIAYFLNNNEETGSSENSNLITELSNKAKYCINLEAARPNGALVDQRLGLQTYEINFTNNLDNNETIVDVNNTMFAMVNFIQHLKVVNNHFNGIYLYFKIKDSDANKHYTEAKNIVLAIQARFINEEALEKINIAITSAVEKNRNKDIIIDVKKLNFQKGLYLKPSSIAFKNIVETAGKECGVKVMWQNSFGGADSVFVENINCATLDGFGPIGGNFHTKEEYMQIDSLPLRVKLLVSTLNLISNKIVN